MMKAARTEEASETIQNLVMMLRGELDPLEVLSPYDRLIYSYIPAANEEARRKFLKIVISESVRSLGNTLEVVSALPYSEPESPDG